MGATAPRIGIGDERAIVRGAHGETGLFGGPADAELTPGLDGGFAQTPGTEGLYNPVGCVVPAGGIGQAGTGDIGKLVGNPGDLRMLKCFLADAAKGGSIDGLGALGVKKGGSENSDGQKKGEHSPGNRNFSHYSIV